MVEMEKKTNNMLGVSVHWLKTGFMQEVHDAGFDASTATIYDIEPAVIRAKSKDIACPIDGRQGSSYVHALLELHLSAEEEGTKNTSPSCCCFRKSDDVSITSAVGPATFMLSYGWGYKVKDIVDALADYCASNNLDPENTFVWMCCLCNNQHRVAENKALGKAIPFEAFRDIFYRHVTGIRHVLAMMAPWQKPLYLTRIWCIFELYTASQQQDCKLAIIMPPTEKEALKDDLFGAEAKGIEALYEALACTKIQNAKASMESDRLAILKLIEDSGQSYDSLNNTVNTLLRAWVVQVITSLAEEWSNNTENQQSMRAARMFHKIGEVLCDLGEYDAAMLEYKKCLEIEEEILGKDHHHVATSYHNIGGVLFRQGKYEDALVKYKKALAIDEIMLGKDHLHTASTNNNIANVLCQQGNYRDALEEFRKVLSIRERALGKNHLETAISYNNIGNILKKQKDYDGALVELRKALTIREAELGKNHPATAKVYFNIGLVLHCQGNCDDAMVELKKALAVQEAVLGMDHPDTIMTREQINNSKN